MSFLLTCPYCLEGSPRPVEEFRCSGEVTRRPRSDPSVRELNTYVYFRDNVAGVHREWWFHRACERWFLADRDTRTNHVVRVATPEALDLGAPTPDAPEPTPGPETTVL